MKNRFTSSERGTSALEFALLAPVFALLLLGLIDVGRYMYFSILAAHAARAGVQYGSQNVYSAADATGMQAAAYAELPTGFLAKASYYCMLNGTIVTCSTGTPASANTYYVKVIVTGTFNSIFKYPGVPQSVNVSSTTQMRVSAQ